MAGNVQEWCWNETDDGLRFILGGSYARSPFDRSDTNGFRLIRYLGPANEALAKPVSIASDYSRETPVGDVAFQAYLSHYAFDPKPLNPVVESEADDVHWKSVRTVIDAAYGSEKLPVYLLLPKSAKPPYQAVLLHPGKDAVNVGDSRNGLLIRNIEYRYETPRLFGYELGSHTSSHLSGDGDSFQGGCPAERWPRGASGVAGQSPGKQSLPVCPAGTTARHSP
jgi:hypothetical protein